MHEYSYDGVLAVCLVSGVDRGVCGPATARAASRLPSTNIIN